MPSEWAWQKLKIKNKRTSNLGFATFRLTILLNDTLLSQNNLPGKIPNEFGLHIGDIHSAYKLWINDRLIIEDGIVSNNVQEYRPTLHGEYAYFAVDSNVIVITINVTNFFDTHETGIDYPITFGTKEQIRHEKFLSQFFTSFCLGILVLMFIYHFFLYLSRRQDKHNFYFSIICLLMVVELLCIGDKLIFYLFPELNLSTFFKIWSALTGISAILALFYRELFPNEIKKSFVVINIVFWSINTLVIIFAPMQTYFNLLNYADYWFLISITVMFIMLIQAYIKKRTYAGIMILGALIPFICAFSDILNALGYITIGYYSPYGFILFIISNSYIISLKFSRSFKDVEKLSRELEIINADLEKRVELRTNELKKANKELSEHNATKDKFFSIIAHDLRSPFQAFLGYSQILKDEIDFMPKEQVKLISGKLNTALKEQFKLLNDLLNWSRLQTNRMPYEPQVLSLYKVISDVHGSIVFSSNEKEIDININVDKNLNVFADNNMLQIVFRNILSNGIKFTKPGGTVNVFAINKNYYVEIHVADNGIGMTNEQISKLFDLTTHFSTIGTAKEKGSGLGLILCKEIIIKHGGIIKVNSTSGSGSDFIFTLPIAILSKENN